MTSTDLSLPPLTLDDLRVAEPDRDNAEAFDAATTWWMACDAIYAGHPAATIAALLLTLPAGELDGLAEEWKSHTQGTLSCPAQDGRAFTCSDLRLCMALQEIDPDREAWVCAPTLDPASLWETVRDFDAMEAEIVRLRQIAADAGQVAKWAEAYFAQSADDDDVSPQEQAEWDEGVAALNRLNERLNQRGLMAQNGAPLTPDP